MTRREKRQEYLADKERMRIYDAANPQHKDEATNRQYTVYNYGRKEYTGKWASQIQFSHKQRLNEWIQQKSRRNCKHDTALLPWQ